MSDTVRKRRLRLVMLYNRDGDWGGGSQSVNLTGKGG